MKLYTRSGDDGSTGLIGGGRVRKNDPRIEACGGLDETCAAIGVAAGSCDDGELVGILQKIQSDLFVLGSQLATPNGKGSGDVALKDRGSARVAPTIGESDVERLERWIDAATQETEPLRSFILPSGCETAARLHLARAIARRAERALVSLAGDSTVDSSILKYVNRLSDLLFALARMANARAGVAEVPWGKSEG